MHAWPFVHGSCMIYIMMILSISNKDDCSIIIIYYCSVSLLYSGAEDYLCSLDRLTFSAARGTYEFVGNIIVDECLFY